jgi:hypothetical protein
MKIIKAVKAHRGEFQIPPVAKKVDIMEGEEKQTEQNKVLCGLTNWSCRND